MTSSRTENRDAADALTMSGGEKSAESLATELAEVEAELAELSGETNGLPRLNRMLERGRLLNRLRRGREAWDSVWPAFAEFAASEQWQGAVEACDVMFEADQPDSVLALANGIWLAVTFPIDPEMSAVMLGHLVEESPTGSETAAVAAAAAHYIAGLRGQGKAGEDLQMFTGHQLATVARYSSQVSSQEEFEAWMVGRALDRPEEFLPRLGQALDALVGDRWWVDRDALRARLPVN